MNAAPIVIKLSRPIEALGETITEITLREPDAADLRSLPVKQELLVGDLLDIAAEVAGFPKSAFNKLSGGDTFKVVGAMGKFMGDGIGEMP